jgi:photosystem II oxygen-evolving enhancer protein 2
MLRSIFVTLLLIVSLTFGGCSAALSNLQQYVNAAKGYEFLYPNGWIEVEVAQASEGVDVVFRDLIERSENLSVIISQIPKEQSLAELGTPSEVGYRFLRRLNDEANANREAELINAESREFNGQTYYTLEYSVKMPNRPERHDIASVAVKGGKLYTFNLSTPEKRWHKVKELFKVVVNSFTIT